MAKANDEVSMIANIKKQTRTDKGFQIVLAGCLFEKNEQKLVTDIWIGQQADVIVTIKPQQLEMLPVEDRATSENPR